MELRGFLILITLFNNYKRSECAIVNSTCQNGDFYVAANGECEPRQLGLPKPLMSSPDNLVHRMQTAPYNEVLLSCLSVPSLSLPNHTNRKEISLDMHTYCFLGIPQISI